MLLRIALSNLVDNAVKYAPSGVIAIDARLDEQGRLALSVSDEGPGLPPGAADRIFESGQRGGQHRASGFGLGLWVARRIAQLHGGDVEVGAPQAGSCFTLRLPPRGWAAATRAELIPQHAPQGPLPSAV